MSRYQATTATAEDAPGLPVESDPSNVGTAAVMALGAAVAATVLTVALAALLAVRRGELHAWIRGPEVTTTSLDIANLFITLGALAFVAAFLLTGWWLVELRRMAEWYHPSGLQRRSMWWALPGWVVPIVNLWFPYQLVADSSRALWSRETNLWPWWIAWLLVGTAQAFDRTGGELTTVSDVDGWILAQQVNGVIVLIAFVLWWRVVRAATSAARAAAAIGPRPSS